MSNSWMSSTEADRDRLRVVDGADCESSIIIPNVLDFNTELKSTSLNPSINECADSGSSSSISSTSSSRLNLFFGLPRPFREVCSMTSGLGSCDGDRDGSRCLRVRADFFVAISPASKLRAVTIIPKSGDDSRAGETAGDVSNGAGDS